MEEEGVELDLEGKVGVVQVKKQTESWVSTAAECWREAREAAAEEAAGTLVRSMALDPEWWCVHEACKGTDSSLCSLLTWAFSQELLLYEISPYFSFMFLKDSHWHKAWRLRAMFTYMQGA